MWQRDAIYVKGLGLATCTTGLGGRRGEQGQDVPVGTEVPLGGELTKKRECDFCYNPATKQAHECWENYDIYTPRVSGT